MTRPADSRPRPGRLAALTACAVLVVVAGGMGCSRSKPVPGGSTSSKAVQARQQAEKAVMAGARASAVYVAAVPDRGHTTPTATNTPAPPAPAAVPHAPAASVAPVVPAMTSRPAPPARPIDEPVIREKVESELPHPTEADAEKDALEQVCRRLTEKLAELDPPVRFHPTPAEAKAFIRKDSRRVRQLTTEQREAAGFKENRMYVDYEIAVSADQVRELRGRERVGLGLKVLAGFAVAALAGFLFLRADEWTKGYLTSWLAVAAFALAGGVAATLAFV